MVLERKHLQKMTNRNKNSIISLISYDADYLPKSIEKYYEYVDEIILGVDKDRISWSNNSFSFNENKLWKELDALDGDSKISIIEEDFHKSEVAIENDNYERNFLKEQCSNDIIISIDADEQLLQAKEFFYNFLPLTYSYIEKYDICMNWATPYKQIEDMTLVIAEDDDSPLLAENQGFITNKNATFTYARWTNKSAGGLNRILSPAIMLHYSLCREKEALHTKINNIGHSDLAKKDPFYEIWSQVTMDNYHELRNFKTSGLGGVQWPKLRAVPTTELEAYYSSYFNKVY